MASLSGMQMGMKKDLIKHSTQIKGTCTACLRVCMCVCVSAENCLYCKYLLKCDFEIALNLILLHSIWELVYMVHNVDMNSQGYAVGYKF